jgi:formylmethanofuran dehydrogenase subunit E
VERQEVAMESLRRPSSKPPSKRAAAAASMPEPEMEEAPKAKPRAEPKARTKSEPLVCAVCGENPPTIRHFDCGQLVCDECIRKANATRSMSKHQPTVCPKCKMPIIEGSTDEVL